MSLTKSRRLLFQSRSPLSPLNHGLLPSKLMENFINRFPKRMLIPQAGSIIHGYQICEVVDKTSRSAIIKAKSKANGEEYALKFVKKSEATKNELSLLKEIDCPYIVHGLQFFEDDKTDVIVMPYAKCGGLHTLTGKNRQTILPEAQAKIVIRTALLALEYLNKRGIWHRDVKIDNFLVMNRTETSIEVKLADLGFARHFMEGELSSEYLGTADYAAPEIWLQKPYDSSVDIWALGVTMFGILSGTMPFPTSPQETMKACILSGAFVFPQRKWKKISEEAKDLITKMIRVNPKERISVQEALNHKWFSDYIEYI